MNKYLKVFALSSTLLGAIAVSATNPNNDTIGELNNIYQDVEKMQESVPKLSRVEFKLDVDAVQDENVKFISTDNSGDETDLTNEDTITYLNQTLEQANLEYEQLRQTLITAIQDTMENLEQYKNGDSQLTNEQKIYIKEHANSIKYLAETLEDLSEDVICCIDGCENCDDEEQFNEATSKYLATINQLEERIDTLQKSLHSLHFINSISNPNFYAGYGYSPNFIMYGVHHSNNNNKANDINTEDDVTNEQTSLDDVSNNQEQGQQDNIVSDTTPNTEPQNDNTTNDMALEVENTPDGDNTNNEEEKPTTFGLKSNIDTYAPTKRNIDTFFNTALTNNEYNNMYGAGYNPYIYGGGYGMPYGHYGNPYGMSGINSNIINRKNIETEHSYAPTNGNVATNETETNSNNIEKPKKVRAKRAKNIDTYAGVTVQSNINTMGESKISKFFKEKFNNLRNKVRKQTNEKQNIPDMNNQNNTDKLNNSQDNFKQDDSALQPTHLDETSNLNEGIINPDNILENPMLNSDDNSDLNLTEQRQIQAK